MTSFQIMSDLHLEHQNDGGITFVRDVVVASRNLILAGDIFPISCILSEDRYPEKVKEAFEELLSKYKKVFYVLGNHEYYDSSRQEVLKSAEMWMDRYPHLEILNNRQVEFEGLKIAGTTLWFPDSETARELGCLNDFRYIENFRNWIFDEEKITRAFLEETHQEADIIISHHLPSNSLVDDYFRCSRANCYYVHPVLDISPYSYKYLDFKAKVWVHGHSHGCMDKVIGKVRGIRNPLGYGYSTTYGPRENRDFQMDKIVEVAL